MFLDQFLKFLNLLSDISCVRWTVRNPRYILWLNFILNDDLQSCLLLLFIQVVNIKHIIPKFVIFCLIMCFQVLVSLLQCLFFNSTNETFSFFILFNLISSLSQFCKCINKDTTNNITKEQIHEYRVKHIRNESSCFERIHILANLLTNIQFNNTVSQRLTMLLRNWLWIKGTCIIMNRKDGENGYEGYTLN